ncbi:MAG: hypothetical protein KDE69_04090, partial [Burkholderiaceae bacterium]|nr:hypothetical protein [Burkholderiaceae bacterium]
MSSLASEKYFYARTISPGANASLTSFLQNLTANFRTAYELSSNPCVSFPNAEKRDIRRILRMACAPPPESLQPPRNHGPMRFR